MSEAHYGDQFGAEYLCLDKDPEYAIEGSKPNETLPRVGNLWFPPVSPYDILCCLHKLTTLVRKTYFWNEIFYFVMTLLKEYVYY